MMGVFDKTRLANMELPNRFVRSGTWTGEADENGRVTQLLVDRYARLARGGVGLIVAGYAYVTKDGRSSPRQLGIHDDSILPGMKLLASAVHTEGGKVVLEIAHGGIFSQNNLNGSSAFGPYPMETKSGPVGRAMTSEEIRMTVSAFAEAAGRAVTAGFDGVEVDAAHGLAHSQFLSPYFNKRKDRYGGSLENRARFLVETVEAVRSVIGAKAPLLVKMNCTDKLDGGFTIEEMIETAKMLECVDAIEMSGGTLLGVAVGEMSISFAPTAEPGIYYRSAAASFKREVELPLMLDGGIRTLEEAHLLVDQGIADYICMCRPFIREPELISRWKEGDKGKSECISDSACGLCALQEGGGVHCIHLESGQAEPRRATVSTHTP